MALDEKKIQTISDYAGEEYPTDIQESISQEMERWTFEIDREEYLCSGTCSETGCLGHPGPVIGFTFMGVTFHVMGYDEGNTFKPGEYTEIEQAVTTLSAFRNYLSRWKDLLENLESREVSRLMQGVLDELEGWHDNEFIAYPQQVVVKLRFIEFVHRNLLDAVENHECLLRLLGWKGDMDYFDFVEGLCCYIRTTELERVIFRDNWKIEEADRIAAQGLLTDALLEIEEAKGLLGKGGDDTLKGRVESVLSELHEAKSKLKDLAGLSTLFETTNAELITLKQELAIREKYDVAINAALEAASDLFGQNLPHPVEVLTDGKESPKDESQSMRVEIFIQAVQLLRRCEPRIIPTFGDDESVRLRSDIDAFLASIPK